MAGRGARCSRVSTWLTPCLTENLYPNTLWANVYSMSEISSVFIWAHTEW